nr:hypothetical protein CFP56_69085 [Quercus suber]
MPFDAYYEGNPPMTRDPRSPASSRGCIDWCGHGEDVQNCLSAKQGSGIRLFIQVDGGSDLRNTYTMLPVPYIMASPLVSVTTKGDVVLVSRIVRVLAGLELHFIQSKLVDVVSSEFSLVRYRNAAPFVSEMVVGKVIPRSKVNCTPTSTLVAATGIKPRKTIAREE